jgi:SAM-dependent methyltransferase
VNFEQLRRLQPISRSWGGDRGLPIDRYYIEQYLEQQKKDIQGHVLEIGDNVYTRRFGGERVEHSDVLHVEAGNPSATIVGDLADAPQISSDQFDCIICTQTLHLIPDMGAAVNTLHRILKPGGILLITGPTISPLAREEAEKWGDYWRFTTFGLRRLLEQKFPSEQVATQPYGNVLAAVAFIHGLATEDLQPDELVFLDPQYQLLVAARAKKQGIYTERG